MSTLRDAVSLTRKVEVENALFNAGGSVTEAATYLGVSRQYASVLVKRFELGDYAAGLRLESGKGKRVTSGKRKGLVRSGGRKPR